MVWSDSFSGWGLGGASTGGIHGAVPRSSEVGQGEHLPRAWGGAAAIARQKATERQMVLFAASLAGLMGIFIILHWSRFIFSNTSNLFGAITRSIRRFLIRKVPRFNSAGHALVVIAFVGINAAIGFTNVDLSSPGNFASRAGWMTAGNLCLVVFLALKNTPLAFLTAYSYERLNCLHQIAGCTMFLWMAMHAITYTTYFSSKHLLRILVEKEQIAAIIAGFAFLSVTFSATVLRRIWYELFYVVHLSFFIVGIVCVGFHQPDFGKKILIIVLLTASMWVTDRLIRISRALYYSSNNSATLYPLPNGGTRVVVKKVPTRAVPGKHFFIWIPAIRMFEMHPFTIVGTQPLEFIINSYDGFTRDLHKFAQMHPGAKLRASVDGPYGTIPDPMEYDKIVLIAGGSGASFTFGLAVNLLERMTEDSKKSIVFIWAVKQHDNISWFTQHLRTLRNNDHSKVNISLFVTRAPVSPTGESSPHPVEEHERLHTMSSSSSGEVSPIATTTDVEKVLAQAEISLPPIAHHRSLSDDIEKEMSVSRGKGKAAISVSGAMSTAATAVAADAATRGECPLIKAGRPDAATLIREVVSSTPTNQRVLVAACGPPGLMKVTRNTTANVIRANGPAVELHCEQFGW